MDTNHGLAGIHIPAKKWQGDEKKHSKVPLPVISGAACDKTKKMKPTAPSLGVASALLLTIACGSPKPTLDSLEPVVICDEQEGATLMLRGSALEPVVRDALSDAATLLRPTIRLEPTSGLLPGTQAETDRIVVVADERVTQTGPDAVEIAVDAMLGLEPGLYDVVVSSLAGAEVRLSPGLAVVGPPTVEAAVPDRACHDGQAVPLVIEGEGFLTLEEGGAPSVTVAGAAATHVGMEGCTEIAGDVAGSLCSSLTVEIDASSLSLGSASLQLANPSPAACSASHQPTVEVVLPPDLDAVTPEVLCSTGGTLSVSGGPFVDGTVVEIEDLPVESTTVVDAHELQVTVGADASIGQYALTVLDPSGCEASLHAALEVVTPPQVFQLDPPVVPSGTALWATAQVADVNDEITDVWLVSSTAEERAVDWSWSDDDPGELSFAVPADLAAGSWQLALIQGSSCESTLAASLEVGLDATVSIHTVDPPFAWTFDHTPVEIGTEDPLPHGKVGYEDVPDVYLLGPEEDPTATRVLGVRYQDQTRLTAIVPPELEPGAYDLLVVNPDGTHGLLEAALEVSWNAPPTIDSLSPSTLAKGSDVSLEVRGSDFRDPTVTLTCLEGGVSSALDAVVESYDYSSIQTSLTTRGFNQALCVVSVTNDDGTAADHSALSITNPAQNLFPFEQGTGMVQARRAPAAAAGRSTSIDRWVYAIGGDTGEGTAPLDSVEHASVDAYGEMATWSLLPTTLPTPRSLADAVTVGRFVYLVGGWDGSDVLGSVHRATILDPLDVPWIESVSIASSQDAGLDSGRWTYRVAALFDSSHGANPDGESLAGEPTSITLPASDTGWAPTLCWTAVDEAVGYRVYRTAHADDPSSELAWLADVTGDGGCHTDLGDSADASIEPLPEGSLGSWALLAELQIPRASPCLALGRDPVWDPELYHLYAAGGLDADGSPLDSIEVLDITVASAREHSAGSWWTSLETLSEPRHRCAGYSVDDALHTVVPSGETWVVFAGGEGERTTTGAVDLGRVGEDGQLESWGVARSLTPARAGFGHAAASDFLYAFGGQQNQASSAGTSAEIQYDEPLDLTNWNSLGGSMSEARLLPGSAQESAVIFVLGGETDSADATTSTEYTHY